MTAPISVRDEIIRLMMTGTTTSGTECATTDSEALNSLKKQIEALSERIAYFETRFGSTASSGTSASGTDSAQGIPDSEDIEEYAKYLTKYNFNYLAGFEMLKELYTSESSTTLAEFTDMIMPSHSDFVGFAFTFNPAATTTQATINIPLSLENSCLVAKPKTYIDATATNMKAIFSPNWLNDTLLSVSGGTGSSAQPFKTGRDWGFTAGTNDVSLAWKASYDSTTLKPNPALGDFKKFVHGGLTLLFATGTASDGTVKGGTANLLYKKDNSYWTFATSAVPTAFTVSKPIPVYCSDGSIGLYYCKRLKTFGGALYSTIALEDSDMMAIWCNHTSDCKYVIDYISIDSSSAQTSGSYKQGTINDNYLKDGTVQYYKSQSLNILILDATMKASISSTQTFPTGGITLAQFDEDVTIDVRNETLPLIHWAASTTYRDSSVSASLSSSSSGVSLYQQSGANGVLDKFGYSFPDITISVTRTPEALPVSFVDNKIKIMKPATLTSNESVRIQYVWID